MAFTNYHTSNAFGGYHSALGNFKSTSSGSSTKGAPKPGPAAPAGATAMPFSNTTAAQNALNTFDANTSIANLNQGLGYLTFDYNDPTNPFNTQAMLQKAYAERTRGNLNSYAARGQGYAGSLTNAQNEASFQNQRSSSAALQAYNRNRNKILSQIAAIQGRLPLESAALTAQQLDALSGGGGSGP